MAEVVWTAPAFEDLEEIHSFIARDSKGYADLTLVALRDAAGRLSGFPRMGRHVPECLRSPYREVIEGSYRVVYRLDGPDRILIMAVVHAARRLRPILRSRG